MNDKGLAHWHVRLAGTGLLARIPKQSQMGLAPLDNLAYEAACFQRAAPCSHVPRLDRVIAPSAELPWGALLVEEITGVPANSPYHVAPIMQALASIHVLPVPIAGERAPLLSEIDPLAGMLGLVRAQSVYLDHPLISEPSRRAIKERLQNLSKSIPQACCRLEPRLITFDAHPGNFLITPTGKAVLVDLEKLRYSYPPLDLAHATLYTSTTWDVDASFALSTAQVAHAYEVWMSAAGPIAEPYL
ncbi:MAG: aminoglycoside phosphotransferase, partial [Betaproteobacteria bacterium HGW-Betaproteobacteria-18]